MNFTSSPTSSLNISTGPSLFFLLLNLYTNIFPIELITIKFSLIIKYVLLGSNSTNSIGPYADNDQKNYTSTNSFTRPPTEIISHYFKERVGWFKKDMLIDRMKVIACCMLFSCNCCINAIIKINFSIFY